MQSEKVKAKTKATFIERYGYQHPMQSEEVKAKFRATMLERYGVEHPMHVQRR